MKMQLDRREFYKRDKILEDLRIKIEKARAHDEVIDYLTYVPDGEPTLDVNLGREIEALGRFGIKTAVITNASLMWREDVRKALMGTDLVSVKIDAIREDAWRKVNRPHPGLKLKNILDGIRIFARDYPGDLITETMLVKDMNDGESQITDIARFIAEIDPVNAYLSIPTRPPADDRVQSPGEGIINRSYQLFSEYLDHVEYLIGYEGDAFACTGNVEEDLLSITAVHPMREDAVREFLKRSDTPWEMIDELITAGKLIKIDYTDRHFYLRKVR